MYANDVVDELSCKVSLLINDFVMHSYINFYEEQHSLNQTFHKFVWCSNTWRMEKYLFEESGDVIYAYKEFSLAPLWYIR